MDYIKEALRTEDTSVATTNLRGDRAKEHVRLLHGAIGLCTEVGELQDAIKKSIFYGKELDRVNLKEELSDIFWYCAILCDELGTTFEEVQKINIDKLDARYPKGFTEEKALNRDLETERNILEGK